MPASPNLRKFAATRAAELLGVLDLQLRQTLKTADSEQVHDLRVATRRFTQGLVIFETSFGNRTNAIRQRLTSVMKRSGELRDFDIALKILSESDVESAAKIAEKMERKRAKSAARLTQVLRKLVKSDAISSWRSILATPASPSGVRKAVRRTAERFFDRGDKACETPKGLHPLRVATKKLRYTLELKVRQDGMPDPKGDQLKQLQSELGDIHDFDAVSGILSEERGAKKVLRPLAKQHRKRIAKFRHDWKHEFAGKKNRAEWLKRIAEFADAFPARAR